MVRFGDVGVAPAGCPTCPVLDDQALAAALAGAFGAGAKPAHRAVYVRTANGVGDDQVVATRARILAAAAAGKAWTVPLFVPE